MICYVCNEDKKTFSVFGKLKCKECIDKTRTGRVGHSGMIYDKNTNENDYIDNSNKILNLIKVKKSNKLFVKWYIEHYPKSKGIVGRQLNYLIYNKSLPIGIISASSPPLNYKKFREFFNVSDDIGFLNNSVFRIVNKQDDNNIGTKVLKIFRNKIKCDYKEFYNSDLLGLITFVEPPRSGSIYKADNWKFIGETQGISVRRKGKNWLQKQYIKSVKKLIFVYKY